MIAMGTPTGGRVLLNDVIALISPTIGNEKGESVLRSAARALGIRPEDMTRREAREVLEKVGGEPGVVGLSARLASSRVTTLASEAPRAPSMRVHGHYTRTQLVGMIEQSVGRDKSERLIAEAALEQGIEGERLTAAQAMDVLELLAEQPGIVGVTARFARVKLLVR